MTWEKNDEIISQMIKGSSGELWGKTLEQSDHFHIMKKTLSHIDKSFTMVDIGCGAGDVSKFWEGNYLGVDLEWVINNVAKVRNPNQQFLSLNVVDNAKLIGSCAKKFLFMNAFLDVVQDPIELLEELIKLKPEAIVIHRQRVDDNLKSEPRTSYAGAVVNSSVISKDDIKRITFKLNENSSVYFYHWYDEWYSIVITK